MQSLPQTAVIPKLLPVLDPGFRPAVLSNYAFHEAVRTTGHPVFVRLALEQADGSIFHHSTEIFPDSEPRAAENFYHVERLLKFLLWSRGGFRILIDGPEKLAAQLKHHYQTDPLGQFDAKIMGEHIYEKPFEVLCTRDLPHEQTHTAPLGGNWDGNRLGFDLGASDYKVAALREGQVVYSEEFPWNPKDQSDPDYHYQHLNEGLKKAAATLPRVDAIGGSTAGVIVNNQIKVASLFRAVPPTDFHRAKNIFLRLQKEWRVPLEVANDGEVTALAGAMSLGKNGLLGIALGSSQAAGFCNNSGHLTSRLNELAFAPIDYSHLAPLDEWSGDRGCGVQYFSQQAVDRLLLPAGISIPENVPLPEKLKEVQRLMAAGDPRAHKIYKTIGNYLGYAVAHYADFYRFSHVLILGRVTSGEGGNVILTEARHVLRTEFHTLAERVQFHTPNEKDKRHGQAVAAATLPKITL